MEVDNLKSKENSIFSGRPFLGALVLYIGGILLSYAAPTSYLVPLALVLIIVVAAVFLYARNDMVKAGWVAAALMISLGWLNARLAAGPFPPNHIENIAGGGGKAVVIGKISEEPDIRADRTYLVVDVDSVYMKRFWIPSFGRVRIKVNRGGEGFEHADLIRADGYLYRPEGPRNPLGFDYGAYLQNRNIHAAMSVKSPVDISILNEGRSFLGGVISPFRDYLVSKTDEFLSPVSAAILSGFILGERKDIPREYQTMFRNTGTLHLMAVSGSNVGMVLVIFAYPLTLIGIRRKYKVMILLVVISFFALLTRLEPSVVRASIMASIGLLAYGWLRKPDYINVLAFAGLAMLVWNPSQLFDVGLQLSFAATFAIIYAMPIPLSWLWRSGSRRIGLIRWVVALALTTVVAQLAVMPLLSRYFNSVPVIGIAANIPLGLLATISTTLGIVFYFLSALGGWLAKVAALPLEIILSWVADLLKLFSSLPHSNIRTASPGWSFVFVYWIMLYVIYELIFRKRLAKTALIAILIAANVTIWNSLTYPERSWRIDFVDTGNNRAWIFADSGGNVFAALDFHDDRYEPVNVVIPHIMNFFDGRLAYVITSTPGASGLLEIRNLFSPTVISINDLSLEIADGDSTRQLTSDYIFGNGSFGKAKVVWGKSDNRKDSIHPTLLIEAGNDALVFAGEATANALSTLGTDRTITLLEMPWSVYAQKSCLEYVNSLDPGVLVFSPDRFTASTPSSRADLTHSKDLVYSTSICGGFSVVGENGVVTVKTMKKPSEMRD